MREIIIWLKTEPNMSLVAPFFSIISLFVSVSDRVIRWFKRRESYKVTLLECDKTRAITVVLFVNITNYSDSPLTITSMELNDVKCHLTPQKIYGEPEDFYFCASPRFPICISPHGSANYHLEFWNFDSDLKPFPEESGVLKIYSTIRKKRHKISLKPSPFYDIESE